MKKITCIQNYVIDKLILVQMKSKTVRICGIAGYEQVKSL